MIKQKMEVGEKKCFIRKSCSSCLYETQGAWDDWVYCPSCGARIVEVDEL
jgi:hypothetical protein